MLIAIVADTHFGYRRFREDSLIQGERALLDAFERVDLVLLAGDIFDRRVPKPEVLARAMSVLMEVKKKKGWAACVSREGAPPIVAIRGTHERRAKGLIDPIQLLAGIGLVTNVHGKAAIFEKDGERVRIIGLGGVPEVYAKSALKAMDPKPQDGMFNIFMFHQSIRELFPGDEKGFISTEDLPQGFDLYVCGHIHKHREEMGGRLLIPGSTVITQMRVDEAEPKGYYLYDTKGRKAEFITVKTRPFFFKEIEFENAKIGDVQKRCREAVDEAIRKAEEKPIIRLRLSGTLAPGISQSDVGIEMEEEKAFVYVSNELNVVSLKEKIERIRSLREKKMSIRDFGMELLTARLLESGFKTEGREGLFDRLAEGVDRVFEEMKKKGDYLAPTE